MSIQSLYPSVRPSTSYNFARGGRVPPEVAFSRGSTGTYVGPDGLIKTALAGEPRFTYDPLTGESLGLLVEEARTNITTNSENPSARGSFGGVIESNVGVSPTGSFTASKLSCAANTGTHGVSFAGPGNLFTGNSQRLILSAHVKPDGMSRLGLRIDSWAWGGIIMNVVDFDTLTFTNVTVSDPNVSGGQVIGLFIVPLAGGWYRVSWSFQFNLNFYNQTMFRLLIGTSSSNTTLSTWSFDGTPYVGQGFQVWGFQAEMGFFPTSYIATAASAVTRAADTLTLPVPASTSAAQLFFLEDGGGVANSVSAPLATFTGASGALTSTSLELSTPLSSVSLRALSRGIEQTRLVLPAPASATLASLSTQSVAFSLNQATGEVTLASSVTDPSAPSPIVSVPAVASMRLAEPLTTMTVGSCAGLKSVYFWPTALTTSQLVTLANERSATGTTPRLSGGLPDELYELANPVTNGRPTLDLDFASRKDLKDKTTGSELVTFTRASTATFIGADGLIQTASTNVARFDHDPVTRESLGLLVEEARTNLLAYSQRIGTGWITTNLNSSLLHNSSVAPDETFTSTAWVENSGLAQHDIQLGATVGRRSYSVFVKEIPGSAKRYLALGLRYGGDEQYRIFDASGDGAVSTQILGVRTIHLAGTTGTIQKLVNGWYRCTVTWTGADTSLNNVHIQIVNNFTGNSADAQGLVTYTGDGSSGLYLWGVQLEAGAFPTSYIPTTATWTGRTSTATFYDANGVIQTAASGVARSAAYLRDEKGTLRLIGLLLEAAATNLLNGSETFATTGGTQNDWVDANITRDGALRTSPDGAANALRITASAANATIISSAAIGTSAQRTFSVFLRRVTGSGPIEYTLDNGATWTIQTITTAWRRYTFPATTADHQVGIRMATSANAIELWGAQLEAGSFATSYIATTTSTATRAADTSTSATVTRSADVASITGTNFSSWYNNTEGTFVTNAILAFTQNAGNPFTFGGVFYTAVNNFAGEIRTLGNATIMGGLPISLTSFSKTAVALKSGNFAIGLNGSISTSSSAVYTPTGSQWAINSSLGSLAVIKRLAYYPVRLPDATLQTLTAPVLSTWDVVLDSSLPSNGICALITTGIVTYTVDWGDETPVETVTVTTNITNTATHKYSSPKRYVAKISVTSGAFRPFYNNSSYATHIIELRATPAGWTNTSSSGFGTNLSQAWYNARNLEKISKDLNTSNVSVFLQTWLVCSKLTNFPLIDTSSGTNFQQTWNGCSSLVNFPLINTSIGTTFNNAWNGCSSLTSFPLIITSAGTNFSGAWLGCSGLTSFPLINTALGTNFANAWEKCSGLTSFPLINTSSGTSFSQAWYDCGNLTSFPLINTSSGINFFLAWGNCGSLTSFPLINTSFGTNFGIAWVNCSGLTSFPLINTSAGTNFARTWESCSNLTSFPALNFNSAVGLATQVDTGFQSAWLNCTKLADFPPNLFDNTIATRFVNAFLSCALTAVSIENIIVSINTAGTSNGNLSLQGGTNAGAATWTANANTAYNALIARGWTITFNA